MKIRRFRWLIATLLFLATGLSFFDRQILSVLAPVMRSDVPMNNAAYSWVVFAYLLSYSAMFTIGGRLIDRSGTRRGLEAKHRVRHRLVQPANRRVAG